MDSDCWFLTQDFIAKSSAAVVKSDFQWNSLNVQSWDPSSERHFL